MGWNKGDFGRFKFEDPSTPRFEVIGMTANKEILILYHGSSTPEGLPLKTFKADCVNWWTSSVSKVKNVPYWLAEGVNFEYNGPIIGAKEPLNPEPGVKGPPSGFSKFSPITITSFSGPGIVRKIHQDFISCNMTLPGEIEPRMFLMSIAHLAKHSLVQNDSWSIILDGDLV